MKNIEQIGDKAKKIFYRMNMKIKVRREAARCTNCGKTLDNAKKVQRIEKALMENKVI